MLRRILDANRHHRYTVKIEVGGGSLDGFIVCENVLRPEVITSLHLARFLEENSHIYEGKTAIDMGSGSGIQGVVMAKAGARRVVLTDIAAAAYENSAANIEHFALQNAVAQPPGDLFERITEEADVVVFNHPFFPGYPIEGEPVSAAIMAPGDLIHRFLEDAPKFARKIIMPFFHPAGEANDPGIQAPKHGYKLSRRQQIESKLELNRGLISIYEFECPPVKMRKGAGKRQRVLSSKKCDSSQKAMLV